MQRREEILRKFGKQVALLRKQKKLSVRELALAADLDYTRVQRIEAGKVNLLVTTIMSLAKGLDVSPDHLLRSL
jgi:transcriptional regulator with XRE-family HTH domain